MRQKQKKAKMIQLGRFLNTILQRGFVSASQAQLRQISQKLMERESRWSRRVRWQKQVQCRNSQPQRQQKQAVRPRKTPPETSPNSRMNLKRCFHLFCLTEQYSYMMSMGRRRMGKTLKWTQRPQKAQAKYLLTLQGCRSTIPFCCRYPAVMFPVAYPPKYRYRKMAPRVRVIPSQLPRIEMQIRQGFVKVRPAARSPLLRLSSPLRSANILKVKKQASTSKTTSRYFPNAWLYLQDGDIIQERMGEQRQVWRSQGLSQREASRKTLQSRSVNSLNFPSQQLSSAEMVLMRNSRRAVPTRAKMIHRPYMLRLLLTIITQMGSKSRKSNRTPSRQGTKI